MRKGSLIEGRIQTGSFEGQDGKRVYTTDVVVNTIQFLEHVARQTAQIRLQTIKLVQIINQTIKTEI